MQTTNGMDVGTHGVEVTLRQGIQDDAAECGLICFRAFTQVASRHGYPSLAPTVEEGTGFMSRLLATEGFRTFVAEIDGHIVGSSVLYEGGKVTAGIPVISVDPAVEGKGVGGALMRAMIDRAASKGFASVRLVQEAYNYHSFTLYAKLGFAVREVLVLVHFNDQPLRLTLAGYDVRPAEENDAPECDALCASVHGHDRDGELRSAINRGTARVAVHDGRITGYLTGYMNEWVGGGHAVGETNDDLKALIGSRGEWAGNWILVPARNTALLRWCLSQGLRVAELFTLMATGLYQEPAGAWLPTHVY